MEVIKRIENSPVGCYDSRIEQLMMDRIDQAKSEGESLGGMFETGAIGVPPGLGSHTSWDRRLDGRIAALMMSIPAIKAVEIGEELLIPVYLIHRCMMLYTGRSH